MTTPKEFDYDLWTTEDGKCYMRVKRTGEQCEINRETMRLLRSEAKKMQREQEGIPVYGVRNGKSVVVERTTMLSLDYVSAGEDMDSAWAVDASQTEHSHMISALEQELRDALTPKQFDIYIHCLLGGETYTAYAHRNAIHESAVRKAVRLIRVKAKNIFA
ncbi:hypothetical protein RFF05_07010 [Bengtsoniella intestinalis]|uniref:hypothetical protein n=1 Tax=Bengtsoniella intestinalis TaxID=3073143 RepID=UPI00391F00FF